MKEIEDNNKLISENMLEYDLLERIKPYQNYIKNNNDNNNDNTMIKSDDIFASLSSSYNDNEDDELLVTSLSL